jgi:NAD(P)H-flavin reductase
LGPGPTENLDGLKYDFPTQNVLLFAAGSGLLPIKAAMEAELLGGTEGARPPTLLRRAHGCGSCLSKFAAWEAQGFEVIPVLSQPDASWKGRTGYVQNALEEDGIAIPRNSGALLCGMKGMTESVKDILNKAGVFEGRVIFNF